jgi:6-pyruvoyltetrahydropterin/6-carboxytetrahydropterin synthase
MLSKDQIDKIRKDLDEAEEALKTGSVQDTGPKWVIDKQFDFCYGHRVWSQQLNADYCATGDACTKCRHLHGHQGEIHVFLEAPELERGMVTDFKHLGWFKNFIDDNLDHKFIIDLNDPWFTNILNAKPVYWKTSAAVKDTHGKERTMVGGNLHSLEAHQELNTVDSKTIVMIPCFVPGTDHLVGYAPDVSKMSGPEQEFYEGFFVVDFLPTSENLTKWMFEAVKSKMDLINVRTTRVTLNETPKSRADYSA